MQYFRTVLEQAAEAFADAVDVLLPRARQYAPVPAGHLERSVESVVFNTSEGVGSSKVKVKIAAFDIARKEAYEARSILRRLVKRGVFAQDEIWKAYNLGTVCIRMLTNAMRTLEADPPSAKPQNPPPSPDSPPEPP